VESCKFALVGADRLKHIYPLSTGRVHHYLITSTRPSMDTLLTHIMRMDRSDRECLVLPIH
jgi:hypothetical protein